MYFLRKRLVTWTSYSKHIKFIGQRNLGYISELSKGNQMYNFHKFLNLLKSILIQIPFKNTLLIQFCSLSKSFILSIAITTHFNCSFWIHSLEHHLSIHTSQTETHIYNTIILKILYICIAFKRYGDEILILCLNKWPYKRFVAHFTLVLCIRLLLQFA